MRCFPRFGKKPKNVNCLVSKSDAISAVNAALAPGKGTTDISCAMAFDARSAPGSDIAGMPASLTQAIFLPSNNISIITVPFSSLLCS